MQTINLFRRLSTRAALLLAVALVIGSKVLFAQEAATGVSVRLQASCGGFYAPPATFDLGLSGYFVPTTDRPGGVLDVHLTGPGTTTASHSSYLRMEPGKVYPMSVSGYNLSFFDLRFDAPAGYEFEIDGDLTTKYSGLQWLGQSATILVRVFGPATAMSARAGTASAIQSGRIQWQVALGELRNGRSAGSLLINQAGTSDDWTASGVFTPSALYYEGRDEISPYRVNGDIRQVLASQACVDVVTLSATSYELRFFPFARMQGSGDPRTFLGFPYVTYRIEKDPAGTNKLRITSETRDVSAAPLGDVPPSGSVIGVSNSAAPIKRTATTSIERTGTGADADWNLQDWNTVGQPQRIEEQRDGVAISGGRTETIYVREPGGPTATQISRTFTTFNWGEEIVTEVRGTGANQIKTTYEYYTDAGVVGSYSCLRSVTTGGVWEAYEYDPSNFGVILRRHRAWQNSPQTPPSNLPSNTTGEITTYTYQPDFYGRLTRPWTIVTRVDNTPTASATISYTTEMANSMTVVVAARSDLVGGTNPALQTITKYYQEGSPYEFYRSRLHSEQHPDGTKVSYAYHVGSWNGSTFTASPPHTWGNQASRSVAIFGTTQSAGNSPYAAFDSYDIDDLYLVDGKSTMEVSIYDDYARLVRTQTFVWTSGIWSAAAVTATSFGYTNANQVNQRLASNGALYDATFDGELKKTETSEAGMTVTYGYDHAGRVQTATLTSGPVTTFSYDAASHIRTETVSASGTGETLVTTHGFDDAGRVNSEAAPGLSATTFSYTYFDAGVPNSKTTRTIQFPDTNTRVETYYADGRIEKSEGSGVVPAYHTYGVDPADGRHWVEVRKGGQISNFALANPSSPRWEKTWFDWVGRTHRTEKPGFTPTAQTNFVEDYTYETGGRLQKIARTGFAATRYQYDDLGLLVRQALDVNGNNVIDLAGGSTNPALCDRVTEQESKFVKDTNNVWWKQDESRVYPLPNSVAALVTERTLQRLTGHTGNRLDETQVTGVEANVYSGGVFTQSPASITAATVIRTVDLVRSTATATITTTRPGHSNNEIQTVVNGMMTGMTGHDGLGASTQYDPLRRRWKDTDQRNNTTTITYYPNKHLIQTITDAANKSTSFGYDTSGRRTSIQDTTGQTYFSYTARNQLYRQWGSSAYPVENGYDGVYGDRTTINTYRGGTGWSSSTWPTSPGAADTTTWTYDAASALLWKKTDGAVAGYPNGRTTTYSYNLRRQTYQRIWARNVTATYSYDGNTGELSGIDYSDTTPDVSYTYTRLGQVASATQDTANQGLGARGYTYDVATPWRLNTEDLGGFYGGRVLTPLYDAASGTGGSYGTHIVGTVKGRNVGFELGIAGSPANTGRDLRQQYTTSQLGRFAGVNTRVGAGAARDFLYTYKSDGMLDGYTSGSFTVSRDYNGQRDLVTRLEAAWGSTSLARFDYGHTDIGQRRWSKQTGSAGSAFADYTTGTSYGAVFRFHTYNGRGELEQTALYRGNTPADTPPASTEELPGRRYEYRYDNAGNRLTAGATGTAAGGDDEYVPNALNQYSSKENNTVRLLGTVATGASVTAQSTSASTIAVTKTDRAFGADIGPANSGGPVVGQVTVSATIGSTTDPLSRSWFAPRQTQTLIHDDDGNLTNDGVWSYTWDAENRLRQMTSLLPSGFGFQRFQLTFKYDYLGRRAEKLVVNLDGTTPNVTTRYLYEGWNLIAELDASGANILRSFTWGLDTSGGLLQLHDATAGGKVLFPFGEANGNISILFNPNTQALEAIYEYSPFGELIRAEGSYARANPFRFSSEYHDEESGLAYYGHRYYSPRLGRFINRDPIAEAGGLNLYGFCANDGINRRDYLGLADDEPEGVDFPWINIPLPRGFGQFGGSTIVTSRPEPVTTKGPPTILTKQAEDNGKRVARSGPDKSDGPTMADRRAAGIMDAFLRAIVSVGSLLAMAGAGEMGTSPEEREMVAIAVADAQRNFPKIPTKIYGVPESDPDRRMADGGTELIFVAMGVATLAENLAIRATVVTAEAGNAARTETLLLEGPSQGKINAVRGNDFHRKVYEALRAEENTRKVQGTVRGKAVNTEPDMMGGKTGITDIKDEVRIGFDEQLRAQYDVAAKNGQTLNLVISPRTEVISVPLQNAIRQRGGIIVEFDPASGSFKAVQLQGNKVVR